MPSVPSAFCLMAMAMRFFSARVSLRAASIFLFTSGCSRRASSRFSARVPMPSSLDTCSSLCRFVMESVPIRTYEKRTSERYVMELWRQPSTEARSKPSTISQCAQPVSCGGSLPPRPSQYFNISPSAQVCVTGFTAIRA